MDALLALLAYRALAERSVERPDFEFLPLNEAHLSPVGAYNRFHS